MRRRKQPNGSRTSGQVPDLPLRTHQSLPDDLETTPSIYLREAEALGFKRVAFEQRKPGDVAIMKLGTIEPMHAAIFVEPWRILHHMRDRRSGVEWLSSYYVRSIAAVYRYAAGLPDG